MIIENLLSKLEGVKKTGENRWMAKCPAHNDRTASLSLSTTKEGHILCKCHASCEINDVLSAVGLKPCDLFIKRLPNNKGQKPYLQKNEALIIIYREVMIVAMCGSKLLDGKLSQSDRDRLFQAVNQIYKALDMAGVRHG